MRKLKRLGGLGFPDDPRDPVVQLPGSDARHLGVDDPIRLPNLRARSLLTVYTGSNLCRP